MVFNNEQNTYCKVGYKKVPKAKYVTIQQRKTNCMIGIFKNYPPFIGDISYCCILI